MSIAKLLAGVDALKVLRDGQDEVARLRDEIARQDAEVRRVTYLKTYMVRYLQIAEGGLPAAATKFLQAKLLFSAIKADPNAFDGTNYVTQTILRANDMMSEARIVQVPEAESGRIRAKIDKRLGTPTAEDAAAMADDYFDLQLPFPVTFIGVDLDVVGLQDQYAKDTGARCVGLLCSRTGVWLVLEMLISVQTAGRATKVPIFAALEVLADRSEVATPGTAAGTAPDPAYVWWTAFASTVIQAIHACRVIKTAVPEAGRAIRRLRRSCKAGGIRAPAAFFVAQLEQAIGARAVREFFSRPWAYRTDRRAHYRTRVLTGRELSDKQAARLVRRGYEIVRFPFPADVIDLLQDRGMALPEAGEWVAVLRFSVRAHVAGPADAPYVPKVQVVKVGE